MMLEQYLPLMIYGIIASAIGVGVLFLSTLVGPKFSSKNKFTPYECGLDQLDSPHKPFGIKFYSIALIFMLMDIETIFLLPWAASFKEIGAASILAVALFVAVPALGLWYVLKSGAFDWE